MADLTKMGPMGLNGLSAVEAAARIDAGQLRSEDLVRDCLARIEAREPDVQAWDYLDPDYAIAQAQELDITPHKSALHGVPIGIKDIFDTLDMPTAHGFPPYEGKQWGIDSNCVAALRAAGMVIMGKTATTEFACPVPRQTRNPHDPERTPGVSSSGSAASVADFMVPLAIGSQTGGSVIGPSANCGVYGYKASLEGIDRGGFRHCKPSIDTIGLFARSVDDLIALRGVQTGAAPAAPMERGHAPLIGIVRTNDWDEVEPCMQAAIGRATDLLAGAGAMVTELALPRRFTDIEPDFSIANGWESAIAVADEIRDHLDAFNDHNRARVDSMAGLTVDDYDRAVGNLNVARAEMDAIAGGIDAFISPSLAGESPVGLTRAIGANFSRLWTQMHMPTVNLPLFTGPNGLPVCFQVIGRKDNDGETLAIANWIDARLSEALGDVPAPV
jgi:Asp-tRNA(Asn)/Glu-tRNA(Gln) amidotransferase A subunit family amidase